MGGSGRALGCTALCEACMRHSGSARRACSCQPMCAPGTLAHEAWRRYGCRYLGHYKESAPFLEQYERLFRKHGVDLVGGGCGDSNSRAPGFVEGHDEEGIGERVPPWGGTLLGKPEQTLSHRFPLPLCTLQVFSGHVHAYERTNPV